MQQQKGTQDCVRIRHEERREIYTFIRFCLRSMCWRQLFNLRIEPLKILILLAVFATGTITLAEKGDSLPMRADKLCDIIKNHDISHYSIQENLRQFFKNDDELSAFIVKIYYIMKTSGFRNSVVIDCKVKEIKREGEKRAEIEYRIAGEWFLFIRKSADIIDIWENDGGDWYLFPPKTLKKKE